MGKTIVYIASSLDGYIARKNDDVSWLDPYQTTDEDYGYLDFTGIRRYECQVTQYYRANPAYYG